jgi:hypothetical protein
MIKEFKCHQTTRLYLLEQNVMTKPVGSLRMASDTEAQTTGRASPIVITLVVSSIFVGILICLICV